LAREDSSRGEDAAVRRGRTVESQPRGVYPPAQTALRWCADLETASRDRHHVLDEPRFTRDADLAVAVASAEAEALICRLRTDGYEVAALVEQEAVGRLATARLTVAGDVEGPVTDLVRQSSGEQFIEDDTQRVNVASGIDVERIGEHLLRAHICQRAYQLPDVGL
jgi:hypothetical protein